MTKKTKGLDDILTIRVGNGELMYIRRDVHEGITATEGQKIRRFKAYSIAEYEKKVAAGYKRIAATGTWVKNHEFEDRVISLELDAQDALVA